MSDAAGHPCASRSRAGGGWRRAGLHLGRQSVGVGATASPAIHALPPPAHSAGRPLSEAPCATQNSTRAPKWGLRPPPRLGRVSGALPGLLRLGRSECAQPHPAPQPSPEGMAGSLRLGPAPSSARTPAAVPAGGTRLRSPRRARPARGRSRRSRNQASWCPWPRRRRRRAEAAASPAPMGKPVHRPVDSSSAISRVAPDLTASLHTSSPIIPRHPVPTGAGPPLITPRATRECPPTHLRNLTHTTPQRQAPGVDPRARGLPRTPGKDRARLTCCRGSTLAQISADGPRRGTAERGAVPCTRSAC